MATRKKLEQMEACLNMTWTEEGEKRKKQEQNCWLSAIAYGILSYLVHAEDLTVYRCPYLILV